MKNLLCEKLAACLCMRRSTSPSPKPRLIRYRKDQSIDMGNGTNDDNITASSSETNELESVKKQLKDIRDLLGTRICDLLDARVGKEERSGDAGKLCNDEDDKENEMKNDWMLAAAVLDRICAIGVTVVYVAGTVVLFLLFNKHP